MKWMAVSFLVFMYVGIGLVVSLYTRQLRYVLIWPVEVYGSFFWWLKKEFEGMKW